MNTNQEMNQKIRRAFEHATPDVLDSVLADCKEQKGAIPMTKKNEVPNTTKKTTPSGSWLKPVIAIAAAVLLLVGGIAGINTYNAGNSVASTVLLDVNPSVEIQINRDEKVLKVIAHNEDGRIIIGDMDFAGSDLDVTVNALIGSMLTKGYLSELANSILVSVDGKDAEKNAALQAKLTETINRLLQTDTFTGAVLSQTITDDNDLQQLADTNHISVGKAQLIREILAANPLHTFEELAPLSINELNLLANSAAQPLDKVESVGSASDKAYIGKDAARIAAMDHLDPDIAVYIPCEIELDYENGIMVYEVEFETGGYEYDYHINATTGEVMKVDRDRDDDSQTGNTGGSADIGNNGGSGNTGSNEQIGSTDIGSSITETEAKSIALGHAGLTADNIRDYSCELDEENGVLVYEIDFESGNTEYNYDINAATGEIVKVDKEIED